LTGILCFGISSTVNCQISGEKANNSLGSHLGKRCSSGTVYEIRIYLSDGQLFGNYCYCENEYSEFNSVYNYMKNKLNERGNSGRFRIEKEEINSSRSSSTQRSSDSSSGSFGSDIGAALGDAVVDAFKKLLSPKQNIPQTVTYSFNGRNYSSPEARDAAIDEYNAEQARFAEEKAAERLKKQKEFEASKQNLFSDLKGITQDENLLGLKGKIESTPELNLKKYEDALAYKPTEVDCGTDFFGVRAEFLGKKGSDLKEFDSYMKKEMTDIGIDMTEKFVNEIASKNPFVGTVVKVITGAASEVAHGINQGKSGKTYSYNAVIAAGAAVAGYKSVDSKEYKIAMDEIAKSEAFRTANITYAAERLKGKKHQDATKETGKTVAEDFIKAIIIPDKK